MNVTGPERINIRPGVSILSVLRHLNYKPWFAMAEFVDNAVQSFQKYRQQLEHLHGSQTKLKVSIEFDPSGSGRIVIRDNAAGIHAHDYGRAFRDAEVPDDRSGLSEFGMGMKSAACWFAKDWCVRTSALGEPIERTVTVISCSNADRALQHYFLRCVSSVVFTLGASPSRDEVGGVIQALVELFKSLGQPGWKSIQGLWGELFLIAQATDIVTLVRAWHTAPEDRYDFASGAARIEVKTASGNIRSHFFSLDQLRPVAGVHVVVASLMVEPSAGGTSVLDLFEEVRSHVASDAALILHMERVLRLSLGAGWRQGVEDSFDRQLAVQSLRIYEAAVVPAPLQPLPPEVSEVRFRVNLTHIAPALWATVAGQSELFRAAAPR